MPGAAGFGCEEIAGSYPMSDRDREVRAAAATLADELIPFEVQAEMSGAISRRRSRSATGPGPANSASPPSTCPGSSAAPA